MKAATILMSLIVGILLILYFVDHSHSCTGETISIANTIKLAGC